MTSKGWKPNAPPNAERPSLRRRLTAPSRRRPDPPSSRPRRRRPAAGLRPVSAEIAGPQGKLRPWIERLRPAAPPDLPRGAGRGEARPIAATQSVSGQSGGLIGATNARQSRRRPAEERVVEGASRRQGVANAGIGIVSPKCTSRSEREAAAWRQERKLGSVRRADIQPPCPEGQAEGGAALQRQDGRPVFGGQGVEVMTVGAARRRKPPIPGER